MGWWMLRYCAVLLPAACGGSSPVDLQNSNYTGTTTSPPTSTDVTTGTTNTNTGTTTNAALLEVVAPAEMYKGATVQLVAERDGVEAAVTWSHQGDGSVSVDGLFTAPWVGGMQQVVATDAAGDTAFADIGVLNTMPDATWGAGGLAWVDSVGFYGNNADDELWAGAFTSTGDLVAVGRAPDNAWNVSFNSAGTLLRQTPVDVGGYAWLFDIALDPVDDSVAAVGFNDGGLAVRMGPGGGLRRGRRGQRPRSRLLRDLHERPASVRR